MRIEKTKLIGRIGCEYYFVSSVFKHDDDFQGVTGFVVRPVSPEEWEEASDIDNVKERVGYCYAEINDMKDCELDYDDPDFTEWVEQAIRYDGIGHIMFDESFCCDVEDDFDKLGLDYECTDCSSCGRIFSRGIDFDEVFDSQALEYIYDWEDGDGFIGYTAKRIFGH